VWRLPTEQEVNDLIASILYPDNQNPSASGVVSTSELSRIVGVMNTLGISGTSGNATFSMGLFYTSNGVAASGFYKIGSSVDGSGQYVYYNSLNTGAFTDTTRDPNVGVFLVSDGGASYGSLNDQNVNQYQAQGVSDVPITTFFSGLALMMMGLRKKVS